MKTKICSLVLARAEVLGNLNKHKFNRVVGKEGLIRKIKAAKIDNSQQNVSLKGQERNGSVGGYGLGRFFS